MTGSMNHRISSFLHDFRIKLSHHRTIEQNEDNKILKKLKRGTTPSPTVCCLVYVEGG